MKKTLFESKRLAKLSGINESWDGEPIDRYDEETSATVEKAKALANHLGLPPQAIAFIVSEFTRHEAEGSFDPSTGEGYGIDNGDGKIEFGQGWQDVWDELENVLPDDTDEDTVEEIYNKFFTID
jgi:hypothetical protein